MSTSLGLGLSLSNGGVSASGPLGYTLYHGFEATSGTPSNSTQSLDSSSRHVQGTYGVRILGNGLATGNSQTNIKTGDTTDLSAYYNIAMCIDLGNGYENTIKDLRMSFFTPSGSVTYTYAAPSGVTLNFPYVAPENRGKYWVSYKLNDFKNGGYAGTSVQSVGALSKNWSFANLNTQAAGNTDIVVDAAVFPATSHKSIICITFDDAVDQQYTNAFSAMQSRGLVGTIYVPSGWIGQAGKLTWSNLKDMYNAGWGICLDSERVDAPITAPSTRSAAITALQTVRSEIITGMSGVGVNLTGYDGLNHFCYSYGTVGYPSLPTTRVCSPNNTTTLAVSSPYNNISAGMRIFGTGVPAGTYVVRCIDNASIETSQAIATGAGVTLTFVGRVEGLTRTNATATTVLTMSDTTNLFAGMHLIGYDIPTDTRIVSVDTATQVTVDKTVPIGTSVKCNACYVDGEFWPSKVQDALIAAGFKSGRRVDSVNYGGLYTGFGLDPLAAIGIPGIGLTDPPSATEITRIGTWLGEKADVITYTHNVSNSAGFASFLDQVVTWRDAGLCEVLTIPAWWAKVSARTFV